MWQSGPGTEPRSSRRALPECPWAPAPQLIPNPALWVPLLVCREEDAESKAGRDCGTTTSVTYSRTGPVNLGFL